MSSTRRDVNFQLIVLHGNISINFTTDTVTNDLDQTKFITNIKSGPFSAQSSFTLVNYHANGVTFPAYLLKITSLFPTFF